MQRLRHETAIWLRRLRAPKRASAPFQTGRPWVSGFLRSPSGIGVAGRLTWKALAGRSLQPAAIDLSTRLQPENMIAPLSAQPAGDTDEGPIIFHANPPEFWVALTEIQRYHLANRMRVGAWVWESRALPRAWQAAAELVDEVWVPSRFCAEIFADLKRPVRVVPHPAAIVPVPSQSSRAAFGLPEDRTVFLAVCDLRSSLARKNPMGAIRACQAAFPEAIDRPLLVLKVGGCSSHDPRLAELRTAASRAGAHFITETYSQDAMAALISSVDVFVSLHRSEGFGLVIAQAMLAGKPAIVTDWSGPRDFTDSASAALVPATEVAVVDPQGIYPPRGTWAEPDLDAAIDWMRRLAADRDLRQTMGTRAAAKARAALSADVWWDSVGSDFRGACAPVPDS